jgi:hypothetical protein
MENALFNFYQRLGEIVSVINNVKIVKPLTGEEPMRGKKRAPASRPWRLVKELLK